MSNTSFKLFADKMGANAATDYIGKKGEIFYDIDGATPIRLSDGVTPGGIPFGIISVNQTFNPQFTDASGTFNPLTRDSAWDRMSNAGAQLMTWFGASCELHRDWRNDIEGLGTLFGNHIPDYRNLINSYTQNTSQK